VVIIGTKDIRKITERLIPNNINAIVDQFGGTTNKKALINLTS